jgi:signal transduction histidine kinase
LYGQPVELLMPERFRQRHVDLRRAYSADPHVRPIAVESTLCGRCKDGSEFPAEISLSPLATEAGILISCTLRDITARRQAEVHLQRINAELIQNEESLKRMVAELKTSHGELKATQLQLIQAAKLESVGTLAAGVAHEVKNPLQTVVMGLDYLDRNFPVSNQDIAPVLSDMREAVRRASSIIQELLELSIPADFALRQEDLNPLVEHTLWLLNNEILASQVTVVRDLAATLPRVVIDKRKMEQVFINLLINALQAMSQGGVLTVATRAGCFGDDFKLSQPAFPQIKRGDSLVVVEVQDSGPGIPEADLPRIFDPFFTTKPPGVGTGLGLSVAKKIIEFHSGAIDIKNGPNGGVLVTLILPTERKNEL